MSSPVTGALGSNAHPGINMLSSNSLTHVNFSSLLCKKVLV